MSEPANNIPWKPGDRLELRLLREDGTERTVTIIPDMFPEDGTVAEMEEWHLATDERLSIGLQVITSEKVFRRSMEETQATLKRIVSP